MPDDASPLVGSSLDASSQDMRRLPRQVTWNTGSSRFVPLAVHSWRSKSLKLRRRDLEIVKTLYNSGWNLSLRATASQLHSLFSRHGKKPVQRRGSKSGRPSFMDNKPLPRRPRQSLHIPEDQRYIYKPIKGTKSVRFLILQPGSGSDPLVGSLQLGSLDPADAAQLPPYEAISYVWGTGDRLFTLRCDGAILPLTQSIRDALVRVRLPDRARRLWADQICINQDDVAERSQQVKLMNAVYKNASKVLVWLGRDVDGVAADAVRMVHELDGVFRDDEAHEAFKIAHEENLAMQSAERWVPLAKLTKLPWFHRIWIVQEIGTTAPATLYWGDTEMDWDMLSFVAGILNERYHHLRTRFFIGSSNIRYLHKRFVEPVEAYDQFHNRGNFAYELHRARHLLAQDPRDHVYAFLGHFSINKGSEELRGLVADYSKSVEEVYFDVAVRGLRGADDLIVLSATHHSRPSSKRRAQGSEQDLDLPSWVPDWRDLPVHILGSPAVPHRASGDTKPELTIDEDAKVLHIRGIRVDVVERHSWTIYGTAFQVRQDDQGPKQKKWWKQKQQQQQQQQQGGDRGPPRLRRQSHGRTPSSGSNSSSNSSVPMGRDTVRGSSSSHHQHSRVIHQRRNSQSDQHGSRTHPMEVLWKQICGFQTFTLSRTYPPFLKAAAAAAAAASSPSKSPARSMNASAPGSGQDHGRSAFFALIQTLTNACTGMDRTRPYYAVSPNEWLASGAAYLVRYAIPSSSPSPSPLLSSSRTFPSFPAQRTATTTTTTITSSPSSTTASRNSNTKNVDNEGGNVMSAFYEKANSLSSPPQTPISPSIHALSLTGGGDPFKWSHEATLITRHRRFAVTRGGYFVLGPDALQEGDVVVLLRGGKTPFLLREVLRESDDGAGSGGGGGGGDWVLVGECYVHGLMDGEGWVGEEDGGREEVFSIR
ncbi:heterokaryon incompatibility domain-containing protein [Trichoderma novae-zelandiae]